jgi:hypothetical protein
MVRSPNLRGPTVLDDESDIGRGIDEPPSGCPVMGWAADPGIGVGMGPDIIRVESVDGIGIEDGFPGRVGTGWAPACAAQQANRATSSEIAQRR